MKTMRTVLAAVLVMAGSFAIASGNLKVNLVPAENESASVEISNTKRSTFKIELKDDDGNLVFTKETKAPAKSYKRDYDFSRLEDGMYFFTVKIENETTEKQLSIKNGKMEVIKEMKSLEPVFVMKNKELKFSYLNFNKEETSLLVYDNNRNLLFEKNLSPEFVNQHGFDFSKAPSGNYEVVLASGNNVYSYDVFID